MLTITEAFWSVQLALCAYALHSLFDREHIFERYGRWLENLEHSLPWLSKPLGGCLTCFAGQVCLWGGFVLLGLTWRVVPFALLGIATIKILKR
jgi:hypothetical protein